MITLRTSNIDGVKKSIEKIAKRHKNMAPLMAQIAPRMFKDVIDHFQKETGPRKRWLGWKDPKTGKRVGIRPYGRGGSKMLQDTGTLRNSIRFRSSRNKAEVITNNKYAIYHDSDKPRRKLPQRKFMWLSKPMKKKIKSLLLRYGKGA